MMIVRAFVFFLSQILATHVEGGPCTVQSCSNVNSGNVGNSSKIMYNYVTVSAAAPVADKTCALNGSSLPVFYNQVELDDFNAFLSTSPCSCNTDVWIGLTLACGYNFAAPGYTWLDNTPNNLTNSQWDTGNPTTNTRCGVLHVAGGGRVWKSAACSAPHAYLCQHRSTNITRSLISYDNCCSQSDWITTPSLIQYKFGNTSVPFDQGLASCISQNSTLAIFKNQREFQEFQTLASQCGDHLWVGVTRDCFADPTNVSLFRWLDGSTVPVSDWVDATLPNQYPIQTCAQFNKDKLLFELKDCGTNIKFVCQRRSNPLPLLTNQSPKCCQPNTFITTPLNVQYKYYNAKMDFVLAVNTCRHDNLSITIFKTTADMDDFLPLAKNCNDDLWTGMYRSDSANEKQASSFFYTDSSPDLNGYNWADKEPHDKSNDCSKFQKGNAEIADKKCTEPISFICQRYLPYYCPVFNVSNANIFYTKSSPDNGIAVNGTATITCSSGYTLVGNNLINCMEYGTWSSTPPQCRNNCPDINIDNANTNYTNYPPTANTNAWFICQPTYYLNFVVNLTCQSGSTWSTESLPSCLKYCDGNPCGAHGQCFDQSTDYICSCDYGYSGRNCTHANYCQLQILQPSNAAGRRKRQLPDLTSELSDTIQSLSTDLAATLIAALNCTADLSSSVDCLNQTTFALLSNVINSLPDSSSGVDSNICGTNGVCISGSQYATCICSNQYFGQVCQFKNCAGDPTSQWTEWSSNCPTSSKRTRSRTYLNLTDCVEPTTLPDEVDVPCPTPAPATPMTPVERTVAIVFTTVGCVVLLVMIGITFCLFVIFRIMFLERMLHMCQEIALTIAHATILFIMEVKLAKVVLKQFHALQHIDYNVNIQFAQVQCSIAGIVLQYCFLVNFTFLMLEALQTYSVLQAVVTTNGFFSGKLNLAIGWLAPLVVTSVTAVIKFNEYPSTYSCWLNLGDTICAGTFVPLTIVAWAGVIMTEAAAMGDEKHFPLTPHEKYVAAHISQKMFVLKMVFNVLSWTFGMWSMYAQKVYLFGAVSAFNICLGMVVFISHTSSNEKIIQYLKSKFCKKKVQPANVPQ